MSTDAMKDFMELQILLAFENCQKQVRWPCCCRCLASFQLCVRLESPAYFRTACTHTVLIAVETDMNRMNTVQLIIGIPILTQSEHDFSAG